MTASDHRQSDQHDLPQTDEPALQQPVDPETTSPTDEDQLQQLHPLSIPFRLIRHVRALIIPALLVLLAKGDATNIWLLVLFVPSFIFETYQYFTFRYRYAPGELIVTQGLLFRSERHVPFNRIHNIDLVQGPLHRVFNVAEVRIETAGGARPEATLRVLSLDAITTMRTRVFSDSRAGASAETMQRPDEEQFAGAQQEKQGTVLVRLSIPELIRLGLIVNRGLVLVAVGFGLLWEFGVFDESNIEQWWEQSTLPDIDERLLIGLSVIAAFVGFVILLALSVIWSVIRFYDFQLRQVGDDLRITCGLLTRFAATIPRKRIQLVSIRRTFLHRWMGRASIRVETAGSVAEDDQSGALSRKWFVPIVPEDEVPRLLDVVRPGLSLDDDLDWQQLDPRASRRALRISTLLAVLLSTPLVIAFWPWGLIALPILAVLFGWLAVAGVRATQYATIDGGVVYRSGIFIRKTTITFYDKIQAVSVRQTPFDRRWKMASLAIDTAGAGPAAHRIDIRYLPHGVARSLLHAFAQRTEQTTFTWS